MLSLDSPGHFVYQLSDDIDGDRVQDMDRVQDGNRVQITSGNGDAFLVDGTRRLLNLSERTHCGHF